MQLSNQIDAVGWIAIYFIFTSIHHEVVQREPCLSPALTHQRYALRLQRPAPSSRPLPQVCAILRQLLPALGLNCP